MLYTMILRTTKLFFKDKGMFFTALITPLVLLVLYVTFLGSVYADSFRSSIPEGIAVSDTIVNSMVAGELLSSLLAIEGRCVTAVEGIIDNDVARSIRNLTRIGSETMNQTDEMVLDIMTHKHCD